MSGWVVMLVSGIGGLHSLGAWGRGRRPPQSRCMGAGGGGNAGVMASGCHLDQYGGTHAIDVYVVSLVRALYCRRTFGRPSSPRAPTAPLMCSKLCWLLDLARRPGMRSVGQRGERGGVR